MGKFTKGVLICCCMGLLLGGALFAIGTYYEKGSQQGEGIQEKAFVENLLEGLDIGITTDGTNVLYNIPGNSEITAEVIEMKKELEGFENIEVDCRVASIELVTGEEFGVQCKFPEDEMPEIIIEGDTLQIKQKVEKDTFEAYGQDVRTICIFIPKEAVLNNIEIDNNVGGVTVKDIEAVYNGVTINTGDVEVWNCEFDECVVIGSVGNVILEDADAQKCTISLNTGDIDIQNCILNTCDIEDNIGNVSVEIPQELKKYSIDVETNLGTVSVDDVEQGKNYEAQGTGTGKLSVENNIGDIMISGK